MRGFTTAGRGRSRVFGRRSVAGFGAAVAAGVALGGVVAGPAAAATKFDGVWTINNGGTGQIVMNGDFTYTATCHTLATFPGAHCPAASGTFSFGWSSPYVTFRGSDGTSMTMRYSGLATAPDGLSQGGYGGLWAARGTTFKCTVVYDSTYALARTPLVTKDASGKKAFALGSGQALGAINAGNYVFLAQTSPGYFVKSSRCPV